MNELEGIHIGLGFCSGLLMRVSLLVWITAEDNAGELNVHRDERILINDATNDGEFKI